mmetsp:Transcript_51054/g.100841  ORF Transcript_51054/g.100841 Transcript_51054/m.100841 type:complete len:142 (-) Transcript_51054:4-429(-)
MQYLATWPGICGSYEDGNGRMMGYILGKAEGEKKLWHGHVTAVTVSPEYRRLGVASNLMTFLEDVSQEIYNAYFVDLFVRISNQLAQVMYGAFQYTVYRQVLGYYSGEEDAYDMRKALKRDVKKESVVPLGRPITPEELEW